MLQSVDVVLSLFSLLLGCIVGSFLNVVILRLPEPGESIVSPASRCPRCLALIHWYDNIPVLSFLFLRGRCRNCRAAISWRYPVVELCMGLLSLALWQRFGPSLAFGYYFVFAAALLAVVFIDIDHQIIPDSISLPGIMFGFAGSVYSPLVDLQNSGLGIICGGCALYLVAWLYYQVTGREGMGGGDVKLLAMIGAFLGWRSLLFVVFAASLVGSVLGIAEMIRQGRGGQTRIPFGPFLSLGAFLYLFLHQRILLWWYGFVVGG